MSRLADYIKARRLAMSPAPDNTKQFAQRMFAIGEATEQPETTNQKTMNQNITGAMEENNYESPYIGGDTIDSPSPTEDDTSLRDHLQRYKKHAMKQSKDKFDNRSYV